MCTRKKKKIFLTALHCVFVACCSGQEVQDLGTSVDVWLLRRAHVAGRRWRQLRRAPDRRHVRAATTDRPVSQSGENGDSGLSVQQMADHIMRCVSKVSISRRGNWNVQFHHAQYPAIAYFWLYNNTSRMFIVFASWKVKKSEWMSRMWRQCSR